MSIRFACLLALLSGVPTAAAEKPNIIFILADDLGYGELGCYGQKMIQTPHLDRLAAEGMRFTRFYAGSTVCAPSRSVLMTGLHTGHTRVRGNAGPENSGAQMLRDGDVTVAELLRCALEVEVGLVPESNPVVYLSEPLQLLWNTLYKRIDTRCL